MSPVAKGVFWIAIYIALIAAPVLVLLLGSAPPPGGFLWDLGIVLGFAGLAMMGVQFVLTARFKRVTAPFGIDIIYYFHRYAAIVAFLMVLAHPVLLFVSNPAMLFYLNPLESPLHITLGVVSTLALVAVMITSLGRRLLALHYDGWRISHAALATIAVLLALVHVQGVGYYIAEPWKRGVWILFTVGWVVVLAYVRVVRPWKLRRHPYRVVDVTKERGDAWTLAVEPVGHAGFTFEPGQFAWLTARRSPFSMREHPFSISSRPGLERGRMTFTIKELGDFTRTVGTIEPGETVFVDGPYGAFSPDRHPSAPGYVLLAGGIGIAPLTSMLRTLADRGDRRPVTLIYAYRRWERMTFRESLDELAEKLNLKIVHVLEEPPGDWRGERGRIDAALLSRHLTGEKEKLEYFVCGPEPMIHATERALHELGVPLRRIHSELFNLV